MIYIPNPILKGVSFDAASLLFVFMSLSTTTFGQNSQKTISVYFHLQYVKTISDVTLGNNPWGIGLGAEAFYNNKTKFKPTIEITGDLFLEGDKVQRYSTDRVALQTINGVTNVFGGASFQPLQNLYLSFLLGPSLINGGVLLGIKPSIGYYFPKYHRWAVTLAYINVFNRESGNFSSMSLSIGRRLF